MDEDERQMTVLKAMAKTLQCQHCLTGLPNAHLLDLHISESHDSFFQTQAERGLPVYQCLVEYCEETFTSVEERRLHLECTHMFCPMLMGLQDGTGLDMMHRPHKRAHGKRVEDGIPRAEGVDALASHVSTGLKIGHTTSIPFGRRKGRGI